ncbi:AMP-binding protein [Schaalia sp. 19OD2882]|uniref:AMP-binding protein n=1 Tax=Schaalia sp. 19OD2882 TaxID=2794089 RepID=UPI001C1EE9F6|nr:AMP-binding protein [Schaalia sp. 19OD2882]QWW19299.1 AMP-binding protein [Schaalia sp. 19OD2882]
MSDPRVLLVPGGTGIGAVALAHAAIHKIVELRAERLADPDHRAPHTIAVVRDPALVPPSSLRTAAMGLEEAFPADAFPEVVPHLGDPAFWRGVDLVLATSGSTAGRPRLVGLSVEALVASAKATHDVLGGPGKWILALPAHHVGGAMVLVRAAVAEIAPQVVDISAGFSPLDLLPALRGATQDPDLPGYLSLVPVQLRACLEGPDEVLDEMAKLRAILVGGSGLDPTMLRAARERGLAIVQTYGMTETCGGCVYDGRPLPGTSVRTVEVDRTKRLTISGPMLFTRYLDAEAPFLDEGGRRWLVTGDLGRINAGGMVEVLGRADDVIISGGLNIAPAPVRNAVNSMPGVLDSWVLGSPDARWGQVVTAIVVPRAPVAEVDPDSFGQAVRDHVGSLLGRPQAPRRVVVADSLPQLPTGKIDRRALRHFVEDEAAVREWRR